MAHQALVSPAKSTYLPVCSKGQQEKHTSNLLHLLSAASLVDGWHTRIS